MGEKSTDLTYQLFSAIENSYRDDVILPLLEDIENYDPANRSGMAPLLARAIESCGIPPAELADEMPTTRFNISKWKRGIHRPLKAKRIKLKTLLWQKVYNLLNEEDKLARAQKAN